MPRARILIVEDDRFYVEFYRETLEREGFLADFARSSSEALRRVSTEPWDLVIADLVLKGVSGLELLTEIKRVDPSRTSSCHRHAVDPPRGGRLRLGASDYLTKPVDATSSSWPSTASGAPGRQAGAHQAHLREHPLLRAAAHPEEELALLGTSTPSGSWSRSWTPSSASSRPPGGCCSSGTPT